MHSLLLHASPRRQYAAVAAWVASALRRGERVLYEHRSAEDAALVLRRPLAEAGVDPVVLVSGEVELLDVAQVRAAAGERPRRFHDLHLEHVERALRDGFTGLAITADGAGLRDPHRSGADLPVHERGFARLVADCGVHVLCRYPTQCADLLVAALAVHHRVDDELWGTTVRDGHLRVSGEIDASNVERFSGVLSSALAAGMDVVDLSDLRFCALAGARALVAAAEDLHRRGGRLELRGVDAPLVRMLTLTGLADRPGLRLVGREAGA